MGTTMQQRYSSRCRKGSRSLLRSRARRMIPAIALALACHIGAAAADSLDVFGGLPQTPNLLGDMGGLRPALAKFGGTLSLTETSEVLGNLTGGVHRGADYDGLTIATFQLDAKTAFGIDGGQFNASVLQIHGRNLSYDN